MGQAAVFLENKVLKRLKKLQSVMRMTADRLSEPCLLFTMDSEEGDFESRLQPVIALFGRYDVPLTLFACNTKPNGEENYSLLRQTTDYCERFGIKLEIASHTVRHTSLEGCESEVAADEIGRSIMAFQRNGLCVDGGVRTPYLSTEDNYRDVLAALNRTDGGARYDSSVCFESNLVTSLLHLVLRKKAPHAVGMVWELPISTLDDYHLLKKQARSERFVYWYWVLETRLWIFSRNYCMILLHPEVIGHHLGLLERFLSYCRRHFPRGAFRTCGAVVAKLEAGAAAAPVVPEGNVQWEL